MIQPFRANSPNTGRHMLTFLNTALLLLLLLLLIATVHQSREGCPRGHQAVDGMEEGARPGHIASSHGGKDDSRPTFSELAVDCGTDKVTTHNYGVLYDKYLPAFRDVPVKMLEIGLGCGMPHGPGGSYAAWIKYFKQPNIHIVEYDEVCGKEWAAQNPGPKMYYGDQASPPFLHQAGTTITADGLVDILIDDGGHAMNHQMTSLIELWRYVRPGGIYVVEDLHTSYLTPYGGDPSRSDSGKSTFTKLLYEILDDIMSVEAIELHMETVAAQKHAFTKEIRSIDCMQAMCVFVKKEAGAQYGAA